MSENVPAKISDQLIYDLITKGDVSKLTPEQKTEYYVRTCDSLGLNPITRPFEFIRLDGKEVLYAKKDATEQLRKIYGVSIESIEGKIEDGIYIVTAKARDKSGKVDVATGAVTISGLSGKDKAVAIMKTETKAKRRVTLSICGLGIMDESEIGDAIINASRPEINVETKVKGNYKKAAKAIPTAKTPEELAKFESMIKACSWSEAEQAELNKLIEQQGAALATADK